MEHRDESENGIDEKNLFTYDEGERLNNERNKNNAELLFKPKFAPLYFELLGTIDITTASIYGFISFFLTQAGSRFYFTNAQISDLFQISQSKVSQSIGKLVDNGMIFVTYKLKEGGGQIRYVQLIESVSPTVKIYKSDYHNLTGNNNKQHHNKQKIIKTTPILTVSKTPQGQFVDNFKVLFKNKTGHPYQDEAKDYIIIAKLIKDMGLEVVIEKTKILAEHCEQKDIWFCKDGWSDFTIGKLCQMVNKLLPLQVATRTDWTAIFRCREEKNNVESHIVS